MLPLTFDDPADYDKIKSTDRISILGLGTFAPGKVNEMFSFNDDKKSASLDIYFLFSSAYMQSFSNINTI